MIKVRVLCGKCQKSCSKCSKSQVQEALKRREGDKGEKGGSRQKEKVKIEEKIYIIQQKQQI